MTTSLFWLQVFITDFDLLRIAMTQSNLVKIFFVLRLDCFRQILIKTHQCAELINQLLISFKTCSNFLKQWTKAEITFVLLWTNSYQNASLCKISQLKASCLLKFKFFWTSEKMKLFFFKFLTIFIKMHQCAKFVNVLHKGLWNVY